jgi:hypothetical protein
MFRGEIRKDNVKTLLSLLDHARDVLGSC